MPGTDQAWDPHAERPFVNPFLPPELAANYVAGHCGHKVGLSEWRAGFRTCERCPACEHTDPIADDGRDWYPGCIGERDPADTPAADPLPNLGQLITPTGYLVSTAEPGTPEWFAVRLNGITATDIAKILDLNDTGDDTKGNRYGNALSVWLNKSGHTTEDNAGEAAYWGNVFEDDIARTWADRNNTTVSRIGIIAHQDHPWQRCALDRLVTDCPDGDGPCALEVKSRSAFKQGAWREDVPDDVLGQTMWQIRVSGFRHIHVACLIGGQRMVSMRVDTEPKVLALITDAATALWEKVQTGVRPQVEPTALLTRILDALYPDRTGQTELPADVVRQLVSDRDEAAALMKTAKAAQARAKAAIVAALGPAETITVEGMPQVTYRTISRNGYTVAPTSYRQIKIVGDIIDPD